jgi:phytoene dehydrogenase-like protein
VERGTLVGTVTDTGGGVLTGANVPVRNTDTNVVFQTKTNEAGLYVAPDLVIGNYEVIVKIAGFNWEVFDALS